MKRNNVCRSARRITVLVVVRWCVAHTVDANMVAIRAVLIVVLVLSISSAEAADVLTGLDKYFAAVTQRSETPGIAIAVVKDGETAIARG
jgi:hypothetical protein